MDKEIVLMGRKVIVVAGMHRSGTSALAKTLSLLGASLPDDVIQPDEDNPNGYFESQRMKQLATWVLAQRGLRWGSTTLEIFGDGHDHLDMIDVATEAIRPLLNPSGAPLVLKNPMFTCMLPLLDTALYRLGADPMYVVPFRNPIEVARSLNRKNPRFGLRRSLYLWLAYNLEAAHQTEKRERAFVDHAVLLSSPRTALHGVSRSIGRLIHALDKQSLALVNEFLDPSQNHNSATYTELLDDETLPELIKGTYTNLVLLSLGSKGNEPMEYMNYARHVLHETERLYRPLINTRNLE